MPHPKDREVAKTLPNGWVMLEPGDRVPTERMYNRRNNTEEWGYTTLHPTDDPYDPILHRALARRITPSEREW